MSGAAGHFRSRAERRTIEWRDRVTSAVIASGRRKGISLMTPHIASTEVDSPSVLLRVSSIERATRFCHDVLGFRVVVYGPDLGLQAAFLSAGVRQQFLLTTCDSPGQPNRSETPGDPHVSICYPTASSFSRAVRRALLSDCEIVLSWVRDGAAAIGVREPNGRIARLLCDQSLAGTSPLVRGRVAPQSRRASARGSSPRTKTLTGLATPRRLTARSLPSALRAS
jgi:catechol 2,3-dioxygenase-like lactoylglutathione lyase family enzyme